MKFESMKQRLPKARGANSNKESSSTPHCSTIWCDHPCLQNSFEVCLAAFQATSLVHLGVFDCGRKDTVTESRDDCCRFGQFGTCMSFEHDWTPTCSHREKVLPDSSIRYDLRKSSSAMSSSSSVRRKRPLAYAIVGSNHLSDDGRFVVVAPNKKEPSSNNNASPARRVLEFAGDWQVLPTSIPQSLSFPMANPDTKRANRRDVLRQRLGFGRSEDSTERRMA